MVVATVPHDLPCRKCGYNLRTLSVEEQCPECGHSIPQSMSGELWKQADPLWMNKLIFACRSIQRSLSLLIAICIVIFFLLIFWHPVYPVRAEISAIILILAIDVFFIASAMWLFLAAPPDPDLAKDSNRKNAKTSLAISVALLVVSLSILPLVGVQDPYKIASAIAALGYLAGIVSEFFQLGYFTTLAARIPDPALSKRSAFLKYALAISLFAAARFPAVFAVPLLIFAILYILALGQFRDHLLAQLPLSKMRLAVAAQAP